MAQNPKLLSITASLILGTALFASQGISQPLGESFISNNPIELTEPEMLSKTEPRPLGVSPIRTIPLSKPNSVKVYEQKLLQPTVTEKGVRVYRPIRKYEAYEKCAQLERFDDLLQCARQGIPGGSNENESSKN